MAIRITMAALVLALLSGALSAQDDYIGFPMERVRMARPESRPPEETYPQNRVIIRNTNLALAGTGMQISGDVWTDFEADRVPMGTDLPKGQLTGVRVNVELYYYDTVLERDPTTEAVQEPKIDPRNPGRLVEGQMVTVTVEQTQGSYGLVRFSLPALKKPLAPGLYRLVARVRFMSQDEKIRQAVKWCSNWYGARGEQDPDTLEMIWKDVMANPGLHEEVYEDLIQLTGEVSDVSLLWIGEVYKNGNLELVAPAQGTDRKPANYLVWSNHLMVIDQLIGYENQLDNVDDVVDKALEEKLKVQPRKNATQKEIDDLKARKEQWKEDAKEEKALIRRENGALIEQYCGRTTKAEVKMHTSAVAARMSILQQIANLQEYLSYRYWCLIDGHLLYSGFHTVNHPAHQAWQAIQDKDNQKAGRERVQKDDKDAREAKWEKRRVDWKYFPAEISKAAFDYLRTKEEKADFDPVKFTEKDGNGFMLDIAKWAEYRSEFISGFLEKTDALLAEVDTSSVYAVQIWPQAYSQAKSARDDVIVMTYSWEYYIRTDQMKEDKQVVIAGWEREAASMPALKLADYYRSANNAPGTVKTRFDGSLRLVRSQAKVDTFISSYRRAIDKQIDPKALPGKMPPSAPPVEK
ncbi:MAG: hypothetical protein H6841_03390 [Planctomycetes bacterium]|nr:hypothetical protein [Planctomycetota bacterium]MCB9934163.1 hypothetical protein [Planctomycetota bacterium]